MYYFGTEVFSMEFALILYLNPKYKVKSNRYKHLKYHKKNTLGAKGMIKEIQSPEVLVFTLKFKQEKARV